MYDVNPIEDGDELALNVSQTDNRIPIKLAIETAHYYGIKDADAKRMADEILATVRETGSVSRSNVGLAEAILNISDLRLRLVTSGDKKCPHRKTVRTRGEEYMQV